MKIIDEQDRSVLEEGRNKGIGFAFCKKITDTEFKTVQPISPCKDYLNDVLYCEILGVKLHKIYGFKYDGPHKIIGKNYAYLATKICKASYGVYQNYNEHIELLSKNYKKIESFLNQLEDNLGIKYKTKIIRADDGKFLVKMPKYWTKYYYLLGLYTLLLRAYINYDGETPALEFIRTKNADPKDNLTIKSIKEKILRILDGELPEQKIVKVEIPGKVHNESGIVSFNF